MIRIGAVNIDTSHPLGFGEVMEKEDRARYVGVYNDSFRPDSEVEGFIRRFGLEKRCASLAELADMCDIGFIHGCDWDDHLRCAMPFLERGKPVFVDKPLVGSLAGCRRVEQLVRGGAGLVDGTAAQEAEERGEPEAAVDFLRDYVEAGVTTCCLCDTIGIADPLQVRGLLSALKTAYPALSLEVHFHDTRGLGVLNTCAALEAGVSGVQAALGGLGGCPFAPGASGNTASEDLIYLLDQLGVETGVDFAQLLAAAKYQRERVPGSYSGHHININAPQCVLG